MSDRGKARTSDDYPDLSGDGGDDDAQQVSQAGQDDARRRARQGIREEDGDSADGGQGVRARRPAQGEAESVQKAIGFQQDDGGRAAAGFRGTTGDCAVRAIAIATGRPYREVYDAINALAKRERVGRRKKGKSNARTGVYIGTMKRYMASIGWRWVATMGIGTGTTVHLRASELPRGRLIVNLSRHFAAVLDHVVHDNTDPSRGGTRCVYGYWIHPEDACLCHDGFGLNRSCPQHKPQHKP